MLGALVTTRREELDLTQVGLADIAGCGNRFVAELEAGKTTVRLDKLLDVLNALGLHLEVASGPEPSGVTAASLLAAAYGLDGTPAAFSGP